MTRSFWGFGYSQQSQPSKQQNQQQQQQPLQSSSTAIPNNQITPTISVAQAQQHPQSQPQQPRNAMIPPNGAFAPATTAISSGNPTGAFSTNSAATAGTSLESVSGNGHHSEGGLGIPQSATMAATPSKGFHATSGNINIPQAAQIQGKLRVRVSQAKGLGVKSAASNPYVVVQCSTSEHISRSANTNVTPANGGGIAIPSLRAQSKQGSRSDSGTSSNSTRLQMSQASTQPQQGSQQISQSSHGGHAGQGQQDRNGASAAAGSVDPANPQWQDEAIFDVTSYNSNVEITIYDAGDNDRFLGYTRIRPDFKATRVFDGWHALESRSDIHPDVSLDSVSGQIHVSMRFEHAIQQHFGPSDFQVLRLIGKGTFGQVYQVRKRDSGRVYAMKVLSKRVIVREKEIAHTIGERDILVRTSGEGTHFLVGLKFSFQTNADLYLITDYMSGGELFWHLQREGRFSEPRAKFYIAELIVALEHLHNNDIVYRDLKPENILLDASGHIALCDFGLSKANLHNGTTNTFCGTTEYLAPEVLLDDKGYTKMVDFWSLGVLIFEMCCGWSPFYAEDNQQMYKNIAFGKVRFPKDALSPEGRDFVKGLLNRNPKHRLGATNDARELMAHPFFRDIDWDLLKKKQIPPPYKPHVTSDDDTSNFDPEFTTASTSVLTRTMEAGATPLSPGIQDKFKGFTFVDDTLMDEYFRGKNSVTNAAPISSSFRVPPPNMGRDDGIDLYDENDIKLSHSHYDSGIKHKFANQPHSAAPNGGATGMQDELMRMDEEDEDMMDDDRGGNYDDFVEGQGFEM